MPPYKTIQQSTILTKNQQLDSEPIQQHSVLLVPLQASTTIPVFFIVQQKQK